MCIILLHKLNLLDLRGDSRFWVVSYLCNRKQAVHMGAAIKIGLHRRHDQFYWASHRVQYSGHFSLLFINVLPKTVSNRQTYLFSVDTSLYVSARSH